MEFKVLSDLPVWMDIINNASDRTLCLPSCIKYLHKVNTLAQDVNCLQRKVCEDNVEVLGWWTGDAPRADSLLCVIIGPVWRHELPLLAGELSTTTNYIHTGKEREELTVYRIRLCYVPSVSEGALLISVGFTAFHVALKPVSTTMLLEEKRTIMVSPTETTSAGGWALQCVPEGENHTSTQLTLHFISSLTGAY